jgi:hypothetical protein
MIIVACVLVAALVVVVVVLARSQAAQRHEFAQERESWREERGELLSRIQRPDRIPVAPAPTFMMPDLEPDRSNLVGTVDAPRDDA